MSVYIEYAFLENFLLDGALLYLALKAGKTRVKAGKLAFSASLGGVFAVVFPLLILPVFLAFLLKSAMAILLCFCAYPNGKIEKNLSNFLLILACFFAFTFAFGGALIALEVTEAFVGLGVCVLGVFSLGFIKMLYKKRAVEKFVYDCEIACKQRAVRVFAFYDSGNFASYKGKAVHFLSPEVYIELFQEECLEKRLEKIVISTLSGEKTLSVFQGDLRISEKGEKLWIKGAYFAVSANMLSRGYKLLLNSKVFEEKRE